MKTLFLFLALVLAIPVCHAAEDNHVFRAITDSEGIQRVEITGGGYYFEPNRIVVKIGVPVELSIRRESRFVPHNFVLKADEAGVNIAESLGKEPVVIRVVFTKQGEYPFYCDKRLLFFASHRERGQEGIIEVVE